MSESTTRTLEQHVRDSVSAERLQAHLDVFSKLFRDSGAPDEWTAARYIAEQLVDAGVDSEILEFDSLISWPLEGKLAVIDEHGETVRELPVRTRSFGAQTPPGGIEGELVFVPFEAPAKGEMIFSHRAVAGNYDGIDVRDKIVLTSDGGPDGVLRAQERGAAGHIHIWASDEPVVHEMICTSIWGTPTPDSAGRLPSIPVLGTSQAAGLQLAREAQDRFVRVRLESNVKTEWMRVPLVTGTIPGFDSNDFLLVGAHIDSWYEGITDNATGDASLIEMARVLNEHRDRLRRGVRFCWWPGHSTGRYSGSTWYADTYFDDLRAHALGYLNIDSPGTRDSEIWDCRYNMGEVEHITGDAVRELSGQEPNIRRPLRAGDQSFLGVGLPSMGAFRMLPVDHPDRKAVGGCGGAYWWHSPEDTLDKADADILARDTQLYVTMTLRMVTPELLPYNFVPSGQDFLDYLGTYGTAAGEHLDLSAVVEAAHAYKAAAQALSDATPADSAATNEAMKRVSRIINPALFTTQGPYEMDPALQLPVLPGLSDAGKLAQLEPGSNEYGFLRTRLVRQRNRIIDALIQAREILESATGAA